MAYPQSLGLHPQFLILNALFSIRLPQISLIQPQFCIFGSSSSILSQKNGIFDSKSPQNSVISNKMSASAACTACSFFQVCPPIAPYNFDIIFDTNPCKGNDKVSRDLRMLYCQYDIPWNNNAKDKTSCPY